MGDLPIQNGFNANIVVDPNFPKDKMAILDMNRIELTAVTGMELKDVDATPPGALYIGRRIYGEYTLRVKNGKKAHALLEGLTV